MTGLCWWMLVAWAEEPVPADDVAPEPVDESMVVEVLGGGAPSTYPGSAVVLGSAQIQAAAPLSANDVLRTAPGLNVVDEDGVGLRLNLGIRGLDPNRSRKVLVLEDGVPIGLNPYGEPDLYWSPPIERMQRIEVVKGSGSVLFGPQTIGGVVNYITRDAPERLSTTVSVKGGSFGYAEAQASVGGRSGTTGWRLDAFAKRFDGPRALNLRAADLSGKITFEPGRDQLAWVKLDLYTETSQASYVGLTTPMYASDPRQVLAPNDRFNIGRFALAGSHAWTPSSHVQLRSVLYVHHIDRDWRRQEYSRADDGGVWEHVVGGGPGGAPENDGSSLFFADSSGTRARSYEVAGLEERLKLSYHPRAADVNIEVGARLHGETARDALIHNPTATAGTGDPLSDERRTGTAIAAWAAVDLKLADRVRVTPGLRFEHFSRERQIFRQTVDGVTSDVDVREADVVDALIPGLGLSVDVAPEVQVYGGVHRGYAPPRTKDSFSPTGTNLQLDAEFSWNYELGVRYDRTDRLSAELTGFVLDFKNQIAAPLDAEGTVYVPLANGQRTLHAGLEGSFRLDPAQYAGLRWKLPIWASYTLSSACYVGGPYDGNFLPYAPFHMLSAGVDLLLPVGFEADLRTSYLSAQVTDAQNTVAASTDGLIGRIDARVTVDAQAAWRLGLPRDRYLRLFVAGKNLTNQLYIASRTPAGIQPAGFRTFTGGLEVGF